MRYLIVHPETEHFLTDTHQWTVFLIHAGKWRAKEALVLAPKVLPGKIAIICTAEQYMNGTFRENGLKYER